MKPSILAGIGYHSLHHVSLHWNLCGGGKLADYAAMTPDRRHDGETCFNVCSLQKREIGGRKARLSCRCDQVPLFRDKSLSRKLSSYLQCQDSLRDLSRKGNKPENYQAKQTESRSKEPAKAKLFAAVNVTRQQQH